MSIGPRRDQSPHYSPPRSVALIGASRREGTIGNLLLNNLRDSGFQGPLLGIHPEAEMIQGVALSILEQCARTDRSSGHCAARRAGSGRNHRAREGRVARWWSAPVSLRRVRRVGACSSD